jgi:hypothetical protein
MRGTEGSIGKKVTGPMKRKAKAMNTLPNTETTVGYLILSQTWEQVYETPFRQKSFRANFHLGLEDKINQNTP